MTRFILNDVNMVLDISKACKRCTLQTKKKYLRDIRRLYELTHTGEVPAKQSSWLKSEKLFKKYKAIPLNIRRALSVAAVKASQAYGLDLEKWGEAMRDDVIKYKKSRSEQKISKVEKEKWPKGGYPVLKKISTELKRSIRRDIAGPPSIKGLYMYSQYISLRFYAEVAFRNDLPSVVLAGKGNVMSKKKGVYEIRMTDFKASDKIGTITVTLSRALTRVIDKYLKYRNKLDLKHDFLIVNSQGKPLSKKALSVILNRITKRFTGHSFGTRLIRVMKATHEKKTLDAAKKIANDMLHSLDTSQTYARKDV
jgi:hypothetical protein